LVWQVYLSFSYLQYLQYLQGRFRGSLSRSRCSLARAGPYEPGVITVATGVVWSERAAVTGLLIYDRRSEGAVATGVGRNRRAGDARGTAWRQE